MSKLKLAARVVVATALAALACGAVMRAADAAPTGGKLDRIFQPDMLGARVAYLEKVAGPAWQANGDERRYKVDGCTVDVGVSNGTVRYLGINGISSRCSFPLRRFITNGRFPDLARMTFADFDRGAYGGGRFSSDCIHMCGNAYDPSVYENWEGPHAENFIQVRAGVVLAGRQAVDASSSWSDMMQKGSGEDYVTETRFNCDPRYDPAAHRLFARVRISSIVVGYDLPNLASKACK